MDEPISGFAPSPHGGNPLGRALAPQGRVAPASETQTRGSALFTAMFLLFLWGIYSNLPIYFGSLRIAGAWAIIFTLPFCILHRSEMVRNAGKLAFLSLATALPTALAILGDRLNAQDGLSTWAILTASIVGSFGVFSSIVRQKDTQHLKDVFFWIIVLVPILATLELYTPFKAVSDASRHFVYTDNFLYDHGGRDTMLYGKIRPKVFAAEPSGPARLLAYSLFCFASLSRRKTDYVICAVVFVVSFTILSSPSLYTALILFSALLVVNTSQRLSLPPAVISLGAVALGLIIVTLSTNAEILVAAIGGQRGEQILSGLDGSTTMRLLAPPRIFFETLKDGVLGTGLGSTGALHDTIYKVYAQFPRFPGLGYLQQDGRALLWANAFFDMLIFLGPIFSLAFLVGIARLYRVRFPGVAIVVFVSVFMLDGGIGGMRNWGYFTVCLACFAIGQGRRMDLQR